MSSLGSAIRKSRKAAKLTQEKLSETVGVTAKYLQYIESGRRNPSLKTLYKIASALKIKAGELLPQ